MNLCFGAHMSVAGGLHRGIERAVEAGCDCLQCLPPLHIPCNRALHRLCKLFCGHQVAHAAEPKRLCDCG